MARALSQKPAAVRRRLSRERKAADLVLLECWIRRDAAETFLQRIGKIDQWGADADTQITQILREAFRTSSGKGHT